MRKCTAQIRESMHCAPSVGHPRVRPGEEGYILLTLLLVVALMAVGVMFGIIIPMKYESQREQETEMIHRGCAILAGHPELLQEIQPLSHEAR